jgi:hypothetical protein
MKIYDVNFSRAQRGWVCELTFSVQTHRQFTNEWHDIRGCATFPKFGLLGMLSAFIDARRRASALGQKLRDMGGAFNH